VKYALIAALPLFFIACSQHEASNHSYGNHNDISIQHISLDLTADFSAKTLKGSATLTLKHHRKADELILDTKDLEIFKVEVDGKEASYDLGKRDSILGTPLIIPVKANSVKVTVHYSTHPEAEALQWLSPEQTNDKKDPFMFSQSQAILARTWIPLQDCPAVRFTYDAKIKVPPHLMAMMSATNPASKNPEGIYTFNQNKPIPSYLMAIAIGNVEFKKLGRNCGVYAEPGMLPKSAWEMEDLQSMIDSAEALYGPYAWGRYDVLVLPPSFPFGGMENPCLTFATPTIIAGDRSLVSLVAHELAHSWSGNLVTNETWNDFWLNEGFTVYFEQRIMEKIYGRDYAEMLSAIGLGELKKSMDEMLKEAPADTKLYLDLTGRNPDDGVTDIAYEKGRFFLRSVEELVGREEWDRFVKQYFNAHAFQTMNTKTFIAYLNSNLLDKNPTWKAKVNTEEWIYKQGLPANCPQVNSKEFKRVEASAAAFSKSHNAKDIDTANYTTHHWLHLLRNLNNLSVDDMKALDDAYAFTGTGNCEIACDWYQLAIKYKYSAAYPEMEKFLIAVGRRKFLKPIYKELLSTSQGKSMAADIFGKAKSGYHAVAVNTIEDMLRAAENP
jgi:leukotriene A-4 hydrolase/aminopeptidase